jgi:UDP-glucuronate 4-epimerase
MNSEENDTVLVTGGRGFIGRALVKLLRRSDFKVLSLDRTPVVAEEQSEDCRQIECDLTDVNQLEAVFEREPIGAVVHLAAILPTAAQREPLLATQVNVQGSLKLIEMSRIRGIKRFVFGSSLSVYGTYSADEIVSEGNRAAPEDLYGTAKLYVEQLGRAYRDRHRLAFVSLRIGRVVGPGAHSVSSAWRSEIFEAPRSGHSAEIDLPYAGSERILVVYVEDVARMLYTLLSAPQPVHGLYNAVCESVVVEELKRQVERFNPRLSVKLGGQAVEGNPRRLDCSRFAGEFDFRTLPISDRIAAEVDSAR